MSTKILSSLVAILIIGTCSGLAEAKTMERAIDDLANRITSFLKSSDRTSVVVGKFDRQFSTPSGRAIQQRLAKQLAEKKIEVIQADARTRVSGDFSRKPVGTATAIMVRITLADRNGRELVSFRGRALVEPSDEPTDESSLTSAPSPQSKPADQDPDRQVSLSEPTNPRSGQRSCVRHSSATCW